jgi:uncharacterized membrane protein YfcA
MGIGLLILGVVAGILSGLFGIGGGIVMVPVLIAAFGMTILDANSTSLTAMLLPVGVLGVISYYKAGYINLKDALWISLGLLLGSYFGGELAVNIKETLLAELYACFLIYIAIDYLNIPAMFRRKKNEIQATPSESIRPVWHYVVLGVFTGIIAGMFGKGGGLIIVPALVKLFGYDPKKAAATSLAALQLPVGLPGIIVYANNGHLHIVYAALIAAGIVAGAFLGTKIAIQMPSAIFKRVYALFLAAMAFYMAFKYV